MTRQKYRMIMRTDVFPKAPRGPDDQEIKDIKKHMTRALNEIKLCVKIVGENCGIESVLYKNLCKTVKIVENFEEEIKITESLK